MEDAARDTYTSLFVSGGHNWQLLAIRNAFSREMVIRR